MQKGRLVKAYLSSNPKFDFISFFFWKIFLVDEIAAELEQVKEKTNNLENSLVNNNLLTSCTIEGESTSWYSAPNAIEIEGKKSLRECFSWFNYISSWFNGQVNQNQSNKHLVDLFFP